MKLYSWNMYSYNQRLDQAFDFIQNLDFDFFCLQEVPKIFLERLQTSTFGIAYFNDVKRTFPDREEFYYVVILTPHRILHTGSFFISQGLVQPLRTRLFIKLMGWSEIDDNGIVYADIQIQKLFLRVFSSRLRNDGPTERRREFSIIANHLNIHYPNIICGDFNIIDNPLQKVFNWLMGSSIWEAMPWYPERKICENQFSQHNLQNPLRGQTTHNLFPNQLDHILIPKSFFVRENRVLKDSRGSDHYPVFVETNNTYG